MKRSPADINSEIEKLKKNKFIPENLKATRLKKLEADLAELTGNDSTAGSPAADDSKKSSGKKRGPKKGEKHQSKNQKPAVKYKGKPLKELAEPDCAELVKEVEERRAKAKKSAKKQKTKPVIEKIAGSVVRGAMQALKNVSIEEIKDDPKKELNIMDKVIHATASYISELKTILGDDWDGPAVTEEMKPLVDHVKELRKKYEK